MNVVMNRQDAKNDYSNCKGAEAQRMFNEESKNAFT